MWKSIVETVRPHMTIYITLALPTVYLNQQTHIHIMEYLFNGKNGCKKSPQNYFIPTLSVFISKYKIHLIITLAMVNGLHYSVLGVLRSQTDI